MTYSILARDPRTGEMGVATQSQAFAVGQSVPWTMPGFGVIATQSMGEPAYGDLGLDALRAGLTASEALTAISSIDAHPERRQVAMIDGKGRMAAYTGDACIGAAGHKVGEGCIALANMMRSEDAWEVMVDAFERAHGALAFRLMAALHAAEEVGGDFRGQRSAAIKVVRATLSGRPWRDNVVDLRVEDHDTPLACLDDLVARSIRYNRMVSAFEQALDGSAQQAADDVAGLQVENTKKDADLKMWHAAILALAGREDEARSALSELNEFAPEFVEVFRHLETTRLVDQSTVWKRILTSV